MAWCGVVWFGKNKKSYYKNRVSNKHINEYKMKPGQNNNRPVYKLAQKRDTECTNTQVGILHKQACNVQSSVQKVCRANDPRRLGESHCVQSVRASQLIDDQSITAT